MTSAKKVVFLLGQRLPQFKNITLVSYIHVATITLHRSKTKMPKFLGMKPTWSIGFHRVGSVFLLRKGIYNLLFYYLL